MFKTDWLTLFNQWNSPVAGGRRRWIYRAALILQGVAMASLYCAAIGCSIGLFAWLVKSL